MHNINFTIQNGWILSLAAIILSYAPLLFGGKAVKRLTYFSWLGKKGKLYSAIIFIFSILFLVVPVFSSITDNTIRLIIGITLFAVGSIGTIISYQNYFTTPLNQVITKGIYKISRNPIYVFISILTAGIGVLCSPLIIGIALVLNLLMQHPIILEEEKFCTEKYKEAYTEYKNRTKRYL